MEVLKTSLVGNILTTNLVNNGTVFCLGGPRRNEQFFNTEVTRTMKILFLVTIIAVNSPTALALLWWGTATVITRQSRGSAVNLIMTYCMYMYFTYRIHEVKFQQKESQKLVIRPRKQSMPEASNLKGQIVVGGLGTAQAAPSFPVGGQPGPSRWGHRDRPLFATQLHP